MWITSAAKTTAQGLWEFLTLWNRLLKNQSIFKKEHIMEPSVVDFTWDPKENKTQRKNPLGNVLEHGKVLLESKYCLCTYLNVAKRKAKEEWICVINIVSPWFIFLVAFWILPETVYISKTKFGWMICIFLSLSILEKYHMHLYAKLLNLKEPCAWNSKD